MSVTLDVCVLVLPTAIMTCFWHIVVLETDFDVMIEV